MNSVLGTPVPKVLAWSFRSDNPVGAEYIIMEKLPGVQLDDTWRTLGVEARWKVVQRIASFQAEWTGLSFTQYGSLYYKDDLSSSRSRVYTNTDGKEITNDRFAVGPSTSRQNTDDGRKDIEFDRGPCSVSHFNFVGCR
jgi:hypothetical protein